MSHPSRISPRRALATFAAALSIAALGATAQAAAPQVGETAPELSLPSTGGEELSLESLRGRSAVILVFYRGSW